MLTASCRDIFPLNICKLFVMAINKKRTTSVSCTKNEWNFLNSGDFLKTFLDTLNCHASPPGYLPYTVYNRSSTNV